MTDGWVRKDVLLGLAYELAAEALARRLSDALAIVNRHNHADLMSDDEWGDLRAVLDLRPSEGGPDGG